MPTRNSVGNVPLPFNMNSRVDSLAFNSLGHPIETGIGERAIVFTKATPKAPLFVDVYSFHSLLCKSSKESQLLILPHEKFQESPAPFQSC